MALSKQDSIANRLNIAFNGLLRVLPLMTNITSTRSNLLSGMDFDITVRLLPLRKTAIDEYSMVARPRRRFKM